VRLTNGQTSDCKTFFALADIVEITTRLMGPWGVRNGASFFGETIGMAHLGQIQPLVVEKQQQIA
jgi:hypothetical protein